MNEKVKIIDFQESEKNENFFGARKLILWKRCLACFACNRPVSYPPNPPAARCFKPPKIPPQTKQQKNSKTSEYYLFVQFIFCFGDGAWDSWKLSGDQRETSCSTPTTRLDASMLMLVMIAAGGHQDHIWGTQAMLGIKFVALNMQFLT